MARMDKLYIPKNIRMMKLISRFSVHNIAGFHEDKVYLVLHFIKQRLNIVSNKRKWFEIEDGYTPLSSKILKHWLGNNYKNYITWMEKAGLIKVIRHYTVGHESMKYRIDEHYINAPFITVKVTCSSIKNKRAMNKQEQLPRYLKYLLSFLDSSKLKIDTKKCMAVLSGEKERKMRAMNENSDVKKTINFIRKQQLGTQLINEINNHEGNYLLDNFGHRFHSPLTRLSKELRGFVTYGNEPLVQIDINNSQLFFSLWLLNSKNWSVSENKHRIFKNIFIDGLNSNDKNILYNYSNTIMFIKNCEKQYGKGFEHHPFCKDVCSGKIFDKLVFHLNCNNCIDKKYNIKRKKVKSKLISMMFADPNNEDHIKSVYNDKNLKIWAAFEHLYPEIAKLFNLIKQNDYKALCRLLQRIESYTLLQIACMQIKNQIGNVPLFTIHDSIVTTESKIEQIKKPVLEGIESIIGYRPSFKTEPWNDFSNSLPKKLRPKLAA